jgi:hypothetical protein
MPVTVELNNVVSVMIQAGPVSFLHVPVPGTGSLPANVKLVVDDGKH